MVKNYSLADYDFTISSVALPGETISEDTFDFTLGGAGNFLDSVTVEWDSDIFQKEADPLGNVVFTKSYARDGTITLSVNMLSEKVRLFNKIIQLYYGGRINDRAGTNIQDPFFSITIKRHGSDSESTSAIIEATYCVLQKLPSLEFGHTPGVREFVFLAAEIGAPDVQNVDFGYQYREQYDVTTADSTNDDSNNNEEGGE